MEFSNTKGPVFLLLSMNETFVVSCSCSYMSTTKLLWGVPLLKITLLSWLLLFGMYVQSRKKLGVAIHTSFHSLYIFFRM